FFQAEDGIRDFHVTGVQTCALPILGVPAATKELSAVAGNRQVKLTWQAPHDGGQPIMNYVIQYSHDDGQTWTTAEHVVSSGTQRSEERRVGKEGRAAGCRGRDRRVR